MEKYLIYNTEQEGIDRAIVEGKARNYPYYVNGVGVTLYKTKPFETKDGKWSLRVEEYVTLTEEEDTNTINSVSLMIDE